MHLSPTLGGSFAELCVGVGAEVSDVALDGVGVDVREVLIAGFSFGLYLGHRGEVRLGYQHRRDDIAGGISPGKNQGSGFLGYVEADLELAIRDGWGIAAGVQSGSALVGRIGASYSFGGPR